MRGTQLQIHENASLESQCAGRKPCHVMYLIGGAAPKSVMSGQEYDERNETFVVCSLHVPPNVRLLDCNIQLPLHTQEGSSSIKLS